MKITHDAEPAFRPVIIHIACESQAELDALYCVFNHIRIIEALTEALGQEVVFDQDAIIDAGADTNKFGLFSSALNKRFKI